MGPERQSDRSLREDALDPILIDNRGAWRILTLNRPDRLNAFNATMHRALAKAFDALWSDRARAEAMGAAHADRIAELNISWDHVVERLLA